MSCHPIRSLINGWYHRGARHHAESFTLHFLYATFARQALPIFSTSDAFRKWTRANAKNNSLSPARVRPPSPPEG